MQIWSLAQHRRLVTISMNSNGSTQLYIGMFYLSSQYSRWTLLAALFSIRSIIKFCWHAHDWNQLVISYFITLMNIESYQTPQEIHGNRFFNLSLTSRKLFTAPLYMYTYYLSCISFITYNTLSKVQIKTEGWERENWYGCRSSCVPLNGSCAIGLCSDEHYLNACNRIWNEPSCPCCLSTTLCYCVHCSLCL